MKTNFPDKQYLERLANHMQTNVDEQHDALSSLLSHCSMAMNWIADYILDENVKWNRMTLAVDDLWLTGTGPEWNAVIIDRCDRSPKKLRVLLDEDDDAAKPFEKAKWDALPILVRFEDSKYKVLDGMHRVVAAIRDGRKTVEAFVARRTGEARPHCEPHVVYDFLRAYHRGITTDRDDLLAALRYLHHSYANVDTLLHERFSKQWLPDDEIQKVIAEVLKK